MSCIECGEMQQKGKTYYYRWKTATVGIDACEKHFNEIRLMLNGAQDIVAELSDAVSMLKTIFLEADRIGSSDYPSLVGTWLMEQLPEIKHQLTMRHKIDLRKENDGTTTDKG